MPNKYSESSLFDLYVRAGLDGGPLPNIKLRGKELEDLVDSFVDEQLTAQLDGKPLPDI